MKIRRLYLLTSLLMVVINLHASNPKREFRGAWLHTVHQPQYARQTTDQNKKYLISQLDSLRTAGVNVVLFQVRPTSDTFYQSELEPWSTFLTGTPGKAPVPFWDPLEFMIEETHKRGMELHAWLNPYRVTTSSRQKPAPNHPYFKHPDRFVKFNGAIYFDPGQPENREFIESVVLDIITRYDVDGIHIDDYFYPYPVAKQQFNDSQSYKKYGNGMELAAWRRKNVDCLIEGIHQTIAENKPWVRFGVSPFGIWRNKSSDPRGSETNGLQNYDDLYADVLLWAEKGWIDYMMPQLYWELEHPKASSLKLVEWWDKNASGRHVYIGQDVNKCMSFADIGDSQEKNQLRHKIELSRELPNIQGNCWWPGYSITKNFMGVADVLAEDFQSNIALPPSYPWISEEKPGKVEGIKVKKGTVSWKRGKNEKKVSDVVRYVVYHFPKGKTPSTEKGDYIIAITPDNNFTLPPYVEAGDKIIVTALDRINNESPSSIPVTVK